MTEVSEAKSSNQKQLLVVDDDAARAARLADILDFLGYKATYCDWDSALTGDSLSTPYLAIFAAAGATQTEQLRRKLKSLSYKPAAVLLMDEQRLTEQTGVLEDGFVARTHHNLKYPELNNILRRAEVYMRSHGQKDLTTVTTHELIGHSRQIRHIRKLVEQVAGTDATVLITGSSGTGKEVAARGIHHYSSRRDKPFVPINCGAIPAELLESELFGHEKGAFTGAINARQGRFELADGGTIFLDEIGDMPLSMQVKLLRVIQERCFERVGSNRSIQTDVRIIAATHRDLEQQIIEGKFREDLFYRLNVFPIQMPTLSERLEDMHLLVNELISRLEKNNLGSVRLTPSAVMALCHYSWPGNIRELANAIERLAILYPYGIVDVKDLPAKLIPENLSESARDAGDATVVAPALAMLNDPRLPTEGLDLKEHLTQIEVSLIHQALDDADGVVAHAANRLGMRRTTLVEKMRKYGIQRSDDTP